MYQKTYKLNEGTDKDQRLPSCPMETQRSRSLTSECLFVLLRSANRIELAIYKQLSLHLYTNRGPLHEYDSRAILGRIRYA